MLSKIKVRLIFFIYLLSSTTVFGNSSESNILIKNQLYNFSTIKNNKDMAIDWELKGSMLTKYSNNITLIEKPFLNIYKTTSTVDIKSDTAIDPSGNMEEIYLNGDLNQRIPGNLNVSFNFVEGESLIMAIKGMAVSSGSACTSASLEPSYVLRALGRDDELAHSSIRMSIGKYTTEEEITTSINLLRTAVTKLRDLSPLWDMYKDGVDLKSVKWASH